MIYIENLLIIAIIFLIAAIGFGYAKGVNEIGTALTEMQIEKYSNDP